MKSQRKFSFQPRIECFDQNFRRSDIFLSIYKNRRNICEREKSLCMCRRNLFGTITDERSDECALIVAIENFEASEMYQAINLEITGICVGEIKVSTLRKTNLNAGISVS